MARRVSLPSADDLFRATKEAEQDGQARGGPGKATTRGTVHAVPDQPELDARRKPSGREKHDQGGNRRPPHEGDSSPSRFRPSTKNDGRGRPAIGFLPALPNLRVTLPDCPLALGRARK